MWWVGIDADRHSSMYDPFVFQEIRSAELRTEIAQVLHGYKQVCRQTDIPFVCLLFYFCNSGWKVRCGNTCTFTISSFAYESPVFKTCVGLESVVFGSNFLVLLVHKSCWSSKNTGADACRELGPVSSSSWYPAAWEVGEKVWPVDDSRFQAPTFPYFGLVHTKNPSGCLYTCVQHLTSLFSAWSQPKLFVHNRVKQHWDKKALNFCNSMNSGAAGAFPDNSWDPKRRKSSSSLSSLYKPNPPPPLCVWDLEGSSIDKTSPYVISFVVCTGCVSVWQLLYL